MEEGTLVEIVNPMAFTPAMFLEGRYLNLKTGAFVPHAGCVVNQISHVRDLSDEEWGELEGLLKVGWTDQSRAGAAAVRGGGAKPGGAGRGAAAEGVGGAGGKVTRGQEFSAASGAASKVIKKAGLPLMDISSSRGGAHFRIGKKGAVTIAGTLSLARTGKVKGQWKAEGFGKQGGMKNTFDKNPEKAMSKFLGMVGGV